MLLAEQNASQQQNKQAEYYNHKCKGHSLELCDRVLLANKWEKEKRKWSDCWESTVYMVVSKNLFFLFIFFTIASFGWFREFMNWVQTVIHHTLTVRTVILQNQTSQWIADLDEIAGDTTELISAYSRFLLCCKKIWSWVEWSFMVYNAWVCLRI